MKLYHIDRYGHVVPYQTIELVKNFYTEVTETEYFKDGLSSHGIHYFLYDSDNKDHHLETVFEYERMIKYPDKLSRLQALYAFDINGVISFVKDKELTDNYFKIYEIDTDDYERHNMNLVRGWSAATMVNWAKLYWEDKEDPRKDKKPVYEYLIKLPFKVGKEVSYKELEEEYKRLNPEEQK